MLCSEIEKIIELYEYCKEHNIETPDLDLLKLSIKNEDSLSFYDYAKKFISSNDPSLELRLIKNGIRVTRLELRRREEIVINLFLRRFCNIDIDHSDNIENIFAVFINC